MLTHSFAFPADMAQCRQMIRQGSKSFHLASLLLPDNHREDARCLYGFCRMADDLVDGASIPQHATVELTRRLDGIYAGTPYNEATDRAFADVVHRFAIPRAVPDALIEGFVWDAEGRRYETLSDVTAYAVRVAGTVGVMMSLIMGRRDALALARAIDLGVAMQFSNIARDVVEDAGLGRVYLPDDLLNESNVTREDVLKSPRVGAPAATRLVQMAERLYDQAEIGIALLPRACRASINAARLLYREIGLQASQQGHEQRAVVSLQRKLGLVARAVVQTPFLRVQSTSDCLPEARYLLQAVSETPLQPDAYQGIEGRIRWVTDMFSAVEARKS